MKRLLAALFVLGLASLACSWSDVTVPTPAFIPSVQVPPSATPYLATVTPTFPPPSATAFLPATETPTALPPTETATATQPAPSATATAAAVTATRTLAPPPTSTATPDASTTPPTPTFTTVPPTPTFTTVPPTPTFTTVPPTPTFTTVPPTPTFTTVPPTPTFTTVPPTPTFTTVPPTPTFTPVSDVCIPLYSNWFESEVVTLINEERARDGLDPLTMQNQLWAAARGHSEDMACNDFISHTGSDGSSPWARIAAEGYVYSMAAENVAGGQPTPQEVVAAWMASDSHRANIMNPDFVHIGVGYAYLEGTTFGAYWTAVFARP